MDERENRGVFGSFLLFVATFGVVVTPNHLLGAFVAIAAYLGGLFLSRLRIDRFLSLSGQTRGVGALGIAGTVLGLGIAAILPGAYESGIELMTACAAFGSGHLRSMTRRNARDSAVHKAQNSID